MLPLAPLPIPKTPYQSPGPVLATLLCVLAWAALPPFLIPTEDGGAALSPTRSAKLQHELEALENAEQYGLYARDAGYYACHHCPNKLIWLHQGEVWKYGITRTGQQARYPHMPDDRLLYVTEYRGALQECMRLEKTKIYHYAILPENLRRTPPFILIRPPGNKVDN